MAATSLGAASGLDSFDDEGARFSQKSAWLMCPPPLKRIAASWAAESSSLPSDKALVETSSALFKFVM